MKKYVIFSKKEKRKLKDEVIVIGAGLAGSEAAYQIAQKGIKVKLYEMKPKNILQLIAILILQRLFVAILLSQICLQMHVVC